MGIDENDLKKISEMVAASMAANNAEIEKKLGAAISSTVDKALKGMKFDEKLGAFENGLKELKAKAEEQGEEAPPKKGKGRSEDEVDVSSTPAFKKLQAEIENQKKLAQASEDARKQEHEKRRQSVMRQKLTDALVEQGLPPVNAKTAVDVIVARGSMVKLTDNDEVVWPTKSAYGGEDDVDLAVGAKTFLSTNEGKIFLPPSPTAGSGLKAGQGGSAGRGGMREVSSDSVLGAAFGPNTRG